MGLRLLERNSPSPLSPRTLSESRDIARAIESAVKSRWNRRRDFNLDVFDTLCKIVAAALNARPARRSAPLDALQKLDEQGKKALRC